MSSTKGHAGEIAKDSVVVRVMQVNMVISEQVVAQEF